MRALLLALITSCLCLPAFAQIYKWVDEKGVTQYGQKPPTGDTGQKMNLPNVAPPPTRKGTSAQDPVLKLRGQEAELTKQQDAREATQAKGHQAEVLLKCAALARKIVDSDIGTPWGETNAQLVAMCPNNGFACTSVRARPAENKCEPVPVKNGKPFIRHDWKAQ